MSKLLDSVSKSPPKASSQEALRNVPVSTADYLIAKMKKGAQRRTWLSLGTAVVLIASLLAVHRYFQQDVTRAPASLPAVNESSIDVADSVSEGLRFFNQRNYEAAAEVFLKLSQGPKPSPVALINLGMTYKKRNDFRTARQYISEALEVDPTNPVGLNDLAVLSDEENDRERAIELFRKSISNLPEHSAYLDPILNLGKVYEKRGEWSLALESYAKYSVHPKADPALRKVLQRRIRKLSALVRLAENAEVRK